MYTLLLYLLGFLLLYEHVMAEFLDILPELVVSRVHLHLLNSISVLNGVLMLLEVILAVVIEDVTRWLVGRSLSRSVYVHGLEVLLVEVTGRHISQRPKRLRNHLSLALWRPLVQEPLLLQV